MNQLDTREKPKEYKEHNTQQKKAPTQWIKENPMGIFNSFCLKSQTLRKFRMMEKEYTLLSPNSPRMSWPKTFKENYLI